MCPVELSQILEDYAENTKYERSSTMHYAAAFGRLSGRLFYILNFLSAYHPNEYKDICEKLNLKTYVRNEE